jgi:hypothetical protein
MRKLFIILIYAIHIGSLYATSDSAPLNYDRETYQQEFISAVHHAITTPSQSSSKKEKLVLLFSIGSSVLGTMPFFTLGYNLTPDNKAEGITLGIISMIPVVIMGAKFTNYILQQIGYALCGKIPPEEQKIKKVQHCSLKILDGVWNVVVTGIGAVSAGPLTYLNHIFWYPRIGLWSLVFDIPTFYVKMIADIWAMKSLVSQAYYILKTYCCPSIQCNPCINYSSFIHRELDKKLDHAEKVISSLNQNQIQELLIDCDISITDDPATVLLKIKRLICPDQYLRRVEVHTTSKVRYVFQVIGGVLGAFSMAAVEPLAEQGVRETFNALGISNDLVVEPIAWLATISAGSLMSLATADSFGKLYDMLTSVPKWCKKRFRRQEPTLLEDNVTEDRNDKRNKLIKILTSRQSIATIATIFGAAASVPNAALSYNYLGVETDYARFALASAIIAPLATYFWAIDEFFLSIKGYFDPKTPLLIKLSVIRKLINTMTDRHILALYSSLDSSESDTVATIRGDRVYGTN